MDFNKMLVDKQLLQAQFYKEFEKCLDIYTRVIYFDTVNAEEKRHWHDALNKRISGLSAKLEDAEKLKLIINEAVRRQKISVCDWNNLKHKHPVELLSACTNAYADLFPLLAKHPEALPVFDPVSFFAQKPSREGLSIAHAWLRYQHIVDTITYSEMALTAYSRYSYYTLFHHFSKKKLDPSSYREIRLLTRIETGYSRFANIKNGAWQAISACENKASECFINIQDHMRSKEADTAEVAVAFRACSEFFSKQIHAFARLKHHMLFSTIAYNVLDQHVYEEIRTQFVETGYTAIPLLD